ncbi:MAG: hypothetical protein CL610_28720 [Anaerolineaceae bacterium]|nr:hypothetical protein [Anaerolineaceae bacterium]
MGRIEKLTVSGNQLLVHAGGRAAPIQLMGCRVASAPLRDDWTDELIRWLPEYQQHGLNAAVLFWQGSSGGWTNPTGETHPDGGPNWAGNAASFCPRNGGYVYDAAHPCDQAAFHIDRHYAVDDAIGQRMKRIIAAMDALDMVAVVGVFYFRTFQQMSLENKQRYDFRAAAQQAAEYLRGSKNILWYPYNEFHSHDERHYGPAITSEQAIADVIKAVDSDWLVGGAHPDLDVTMTDAHVYLFDHPADNPLLNVETFGIGSGGNDCFSGQAHRVGIWEDTDARIPQHGEVTRQQPATKQDYFNEINGALDRPGYHLFAHLQGWYQGSFPLTRARNFFGMTPGDPGGAPLTAVNFYNPASAHFADPVLVDDDNQGMGREGSRGVRWYYEYLRDHYSKVKYPFFENGAWDLPRLMEEHGT